MSYKRKKRHLLFDESPAIPLDEVEMLQWQKRCPADDDDEGWVKLAKIKKRDMNDIMHEGGREGFMKWWNDPTNMVRVSLPRSEDPDQLSAKRRGPILNILSLIKHYPELKPPIIEGLIRRGETMNIVAPPKVGKSWLTGSIALSIILGKSLFDAFKCEQGRVLIIDNELHCETIGSRTQRLALSFDSIIEEVGPYLDYIPLRGDLVDLIQLESYLKSIPIGHYKAIILDAFYKFFPKDMRENDNAQITALYNQIDYYAEMLDTAFILVHHASKGNQSEKGVTDVGAGGGAQSRAADCHLVLREHEYDKTYIIDAAVRSWEPVKSFCVKFSFPKWHLAPHADPGAFRSAKKAPGASKVGKGSDTQADVENASTEQANRARDRLIAEMDAPMDVKSISEIALRLGLRGFSYESLRKYVIDAWLSGGLVREVRARSGSVPALYIKSVIEVVESTAQDSDAGNGDVDGNCVDPIQ